MNENELYEASIRLLKPLNISQTYKAIVDEAVRLVRGKGGSIVLAKKSGLMERVYASDPQIRSINPQKNGRTYRAYKDQKAVILTKDSITDVHPEFSKINIKSYALIPLINQGKSIGILSIYKSQGKFSKEEIKSLRQFGTMGSMAIRKSQLNAQLHSALSTRDLFISMASHELKTPVTTMYVYMQLLKRRVNKGESVDPEWINTLLYETARLTKLIDELLQTNQIRIGRFSYEFEEFDVVDIIKRSLSSFKTSHKNSKVIFENKIGKELQVIADPDKLTQVIINLLDNSAKHNEWENPIYLRLGVARKMIKISVEDNGTGISKEDQKHLFDEFYKGKGHTKAGMGLGLFLVKTIIDKHKGKISVHSKKGLGTKVDIYLPIYE